MKELIELVEKIEAKHLIEPKYMEKIDAILNAKTIKEVDKLEMTNDFLDELYDSIYDMERFNKDFTQIINYIGRTPSIVIEENDSDFV